MNIFDIADQNSDNLKGSYYSLEKRYRSRNNLNILTKFAILIKDKWAISINMRQCVLNDLLIAGRYKNVYELKRERAEELRGVIKLETSVEQAVGKRLKGYYKSRIAFDRTFEDGEKFRYGALNIGGLGLRKYGEYCIVIKRKQSEEYSSLAFIKEDSLNYVGGRRVIIGQLSQEIANRECVHHLVALKHEDNIHRISADQWASMICCNKSNIEAITTDDILSKHIQSVRMSKKEYLLYYDYLYKDFISELSDPEKRYRLEAFRNMQELLTKHQIKLEVIDKNES